MENRSIFWWRHFRSGWRHHGPIFNGSRDLGLIFQLKKFWVDWTKQLLAEFINRHPTFQISTSEKTHISRKNPPTKPLFPLSRQRWIWWSSQIWWLLLMERYAFYFFQSPIKSSSKLITSWIWIPDFNSSQCAWGIV